MDLRCEGGVAIHVEETENRRPASVVSGERAVTADVVHDVVREDPGERVDVVPRERLVFAPEQFLVGMHSSRTLALVVRR